MIKIHYTQSVFYSLVLAATLGVGVTQAKAMDGVLSKTPNTKDSYCHLKFPAIRPSTLATNHPQLKNSATGDIIDYYGSCAHDPRGKSEAQTQRDEYEFQWDSNYAS